MILDPTSGPQKIKISAVTTIYLLCLESSRDCSRWFCGGSGVVVWGCAEILLGSFQGRLGVVLGSFWGRPEAFWSRYGAYWGSFWSILESFWRVQGSFWSVLERTGGVLEHLESILDHPGSFSIILRVILNGPGLVLGRSRRVLERSRRVLDTFWGHSSAREVTIVRVGV